MEANGSILLCQTTLQSLPMLYILWHSDSSLLNPNKSDTKRIVEQILLAFLDCTSGRGLYCRVKIPLKVKTMETSNYKRSARTLQINHTLSSNSEAGSLCQSSVPFINDCLSLTPVHWHDVVGSRNEDLASL